MNFVVMGAGLFAGAVIEDVVPALTLPGRFEAPILLTLVLYYALSRSMGLTIIAAVVGGVLCDSVGGLPMGASAFCFCTIGAAARQCHDVVFGGKWITSMFFGLVAGAAYTVMLYAILAFADADMRGVPLSWVAAKTAGTAALGAIVAPPVFGFMQWLDARVGNVRMADAQ